MVHKLVDEPYLEHDSRLLAIFVVYKYMKFIPKLHLVICASTFATRFLG